MHSKGVLKTVRRYLKSISRFWTPSTKGFPSSSNGHRTETYEFTMFRPTFKVSRNNHTSCVPTEGSDITLYICYIYIYIYIYRTYISTSHHGRTWHCSDDPLSVLVRCRGRLGQSRSLCKTNGRCPSNEWIVMEALPSGVT